MGEKIQTTSPLKVQIHSPKFMHAPREGLYQSCAKNCHFHFLPLFFVFVNLGPYGSVSTESLKVHTIFTPLNPCIFIERISGKVLKRILIFHTLKRWPWSEADQTFGTRGQILSVCRVGLTVNIQCQSEIIQCISDFFKFRFSTILYLKKGWS